MVTSSRSYQRNTHVKYQQSSNHCSTFISKLKVFKRWVKLQSQCRRVKNIGTHGKVLSQGILMRNIKALALIVQKLSARLKFQRAQNDRYTNRIKAICPRYSISGEKKVYYTLILNSYFQR